MTKQEAMEALDEGKVITHKYFSPNEFIKKHREGTLLDENGYKLSEWDFWYHRTQSFFDNGWEIFK